MCDKRVLTLLLWLGGKGKGAESAGEKFLRKNQVKKGGL